MLKDQSIGNAIRNVLPTGSVEIIEEKEALPGSDNSNWSVCPLFPTDVFAVSGYLLKLGGAIAYFDPCPYEGEQHSASEHYYFSKSERESADRIAELWRDIEKNPYGHPPEEVIKLWSELIDLWDEPVTPPNSIELETTKIRAWWKPAFLLVVISDMACNRILRDQVSGGSPSYFEQWLENWHLDQYQANDFDGESLEGEDEYRETSGVETPKPPASLTLLADRSVVCVLPKVRVSPIGATLRNLTRNLSLLPGRGEVRCSWYDLPEENNEEDLETLDVLLIPEPISIDAMWFESGAKEDEDPADLHYWKRDWEHFHIRQAWIGNDKQRENFLKRCEGLMKSALKESRRINGVVLPEYALDYELFERLCVRLKGIEKRLEFVIAGSSDNCLSEEDQSSADGNHVLTRVWYKNSELHRTTSRRKHHRWRIDRRQVESYALAPALNPKIKFWWERCSLGRREVHFHRFRKRSVFSVLICEDLARSDPCHEVLRSVAPNLIFALLLDGPQIVSRWPAQYASNLADDPGSSVLTMTSFGLIERSIKTGKFKPNRSIAMWKDDSGKVVEIKMPEGNGARGVLLSLWSDHVSDRTIAGKNNLARSWRYSCHYPIYGEASASEQDEFDQ